MGETAYYIFDILTIIVVGGVWFALCFAMLQHVVFWTGLGRSLFMFFLMTAVAVAHSLAWRLVTGGPQPAWASMVFRVPIFCAGLGILWFLWRYPWPLPSEGIRWADLLGFRREDDE